MTMNKYLVKITHATGTVTVWIAATDYYDAGNKARKLYKGVTHTEVIK